MRAAGEQAPEVGFGAPQACKVKLVRTLGELRDPEKPVGRKRTYFDFEVQVRHELLQIRCALHLGAELATLRVVGVAVPVFIGYHRMIEGPDVIEKMTCLLNGQRNG